MNQIRTPKPITFLLIFCMLFSSVSFSSNTKAAKVPKINIGKNLGITVGSSKKLSIKKNGVKKLTKVTWKSSKKSVASLNKTTGSSVTLKALKKGKAKITATVRYKISSSSSVKLKKLTCNITVTNASITTESPAVSSTTPTPVDRKSVV